MTSRDFCYWLQGYLEINAADATPTRGLGPTQVECIQKHLALAFKHEIDPSAGPPEHQAKLNEIHSGRPPTAGQGVVTIQDGQADWSNIRMRC